MEITLLIIVLWLMWIFIFIGVGRAVLLQVDLFVHQKSSEVINEKDNRGTDHLFECFWIGWVLSLFFLQIGHFFAPIRTSAFILCMIISLAGWLGCWKQLKLNRLKFNAHAILFFVSWSLLAVWLALRLWSIEYLDDHAAYYLQQIFWAKNYPIIPGLANTS